MVRSFEYRQPRLHTNFELDFHIGGEVLHGQCTDVSNGGVSAVFDSGKMKLGDHGSLVLRHPLRQFTLDASVAHLDGDQVGLVFATRSQEERRASEQFTSMVGMTELSE